MTRCRRMGFRVLAAAIVCAALPGCGGGGPGVTTATVTSVTASCANSSVAQGLVDQCTATVQGTGNFSTAVNWTATGGTISSAGLFAAPAATGSVSITATSATDPGQKGVTIVTVDTPQKASFDYEGITHVSYNEGEYTSSGAPAEDALAATGAAWAGVLVTWYQSDKNATTIALATNSPSDQDVVAAITELHNRGVKVMLKPHVDAVNGDWRGTFAPSDVNAWFTSYNDFIMHWATIAKANHVEMLCIGTEFVLLSGSTYLSNWTTMINNIRSVYSTPGLLTYAANATSATDEFKSVSFWSQLDVIGLDAYFPLTNQSDPTIAQLVAAWSNNKNSENVVADVQNFSAAFPTQPVIFTEIGYRSISGANMAPYDFTVTGAVDDPEQQDCYEAMYQVWSQQSSVMRGNFWWDWPVAPPASTDTDYNPRNKPAQTVLQNWQ
jgi:hypothetical protein